MVSTAVRSDTLSRGLRTAVALSSLFCIAVVWYQGTVVKEYVTVARYPPVRGNAAAEADIKMTFQYFNTRLAVSLLTNVSALLPLIYDDNGSWHKVSANTYVRSAFLEPNNRIEIISLVSKYGKIPSGLRCIVRNEFNSTSTKAALKTLERPGGPSLRAALIRCQLDYGISNVEQVALTENTAAKNLLWLKVLTKRDGLRVDFSMCIQPLYGRRNHLFQLAEFLSYYAVLGVTRFTFYLLEASRAEEQLVLRLRARHAVTIVLVSWRNTPRNSRLFAQAAAMHDCLYRERFLSEYVVYADIDEFMVLKRGRTLHETLYLLSNDSTVSSFIVAHKPVCTQYRSVAPRYELVPPMMTVLYKLAYNVSWRYGDRSKWIVKPEDIVSASTHCIYEHVEGKQGLNVNVSIMELYHYRSCSALGLKIADEPRVKVPNVGAYVEDILNTDTFIFLASLLRYRSWRSGSNGEDGQ